MTTSAITAPPVGLHVGTITKHIKPALTAFIHRFYPGARMELRTSDLEGYGVYVALDVYLGNTVVIGEHSAQNGVLEEELDAVILKLKTHIRMQTLSAAKIDAMQALAARRSGDKDRRVRFHRGMKFQGFEGLVCTLEWDGGQYTLPLNVDAEMAEITRQVIACIKDVVPQE